MDCTRPITHMHFKLIYLSSSRIDGASRASPRPAPRYISRRGDPTSISSVRDATGAGWVASGLAPEGRGFTFFKVVM